jgi:hypothetical protein
VVLDDENMYIYKSEVARASPDVLPLFLASVKETTLDKHPDHYQLEVCNNVSRYEFATSAVRDVKRWLSALETVCARLLQRELGLAAHATPRGDATVLDCVLLEARDLSLPSTPLTSSDSGAGAASGEQPAVYCVLRCNAQSVRLATASASNDPSWARGDGSEPHDATLGTAHNASFVLPREHERATNMTVRIELFDAHRDTLLGFTQVTRRVVARAI